MQNKGIRQYSVACLDDDNNKFYAFTKAESKSHARAIINDRIRRKCATELKAALHDNMTLYKAIVGRMKQVAWTAKSY